MSEIKFHINLNTADIVHRCHVAKTGCHMINKAMSTEPTHFHHQNCNFHLKHTLPAMAR